MSSNYIPKQKQIVKQSILSKLGEKLLFSFYIGKVKIQGDFQGGSLWKFGITVYPQYKQFEFNLGKYLINFWYRKDLVK